MVFESTVLRIIFGPNREVTGRWKVHDEELCNIHALPNIVQVSRLSYQGGWDGQNMWHAQERW